MKLNKGDIIKDGENLYSIFCVMMSVIYVKRMTEFIDTPCYELEEVLKHYRKIEIMNN